MQNAFTHLKHGRNFSQLSWGQNRTSIFNKIWFRFLYVNDKRLCWVTRVTKQTKICLTVFVVVCTVLCVHSVPYKMETSHNPPGLHTFTRPSKFKIKSSKITFHTWSTHYLILNVYLQFGILFGKVFHWAVDWVYTCTVNQVMGPERDSERALHLLTTSISPTSPNHHITISHWSKSPEDVTGLIRYCASAIL